VPADGGPTTVELVGVGRAIPGTEIRIVGADGVMLGPRQVGEVWVRSGTLMQGYYGDAEGTAAVMTDGWLRTGDLGYQVDGTLFITGRMKDVIIKGGHNLLPSAIEEVAEGVDGVRHGGAAAVGIRSPEQHTELVYVVAETKVAPPDRPVLAERIRDALKVRGMAADHVLLVGRASLPRTTSGKIKRGEVARAITAGDL
jgi:acyl-CoA synthetase (AMP-forming)/AMP-acid ligase II